MLFKNQKQLIENGQTPKLKQIRSEILEIISAAVDAVNPYKSVKSVVKTNKIILSDEEINIKDFNNIYVVGFGKASVGMAQAVSDSINISKGIVVTNNKDDFVKNEKIETIIGSHPIPDKNCIIAADKIINLIDKCKKDDLLIVLISGGGSALLCKPRISLKNLQITTDLLLKSGTNIKEINTIRKHLSYVKGGQLIKHAKCKVVSLIISDIIGDPIEFISSGPTSPDSTTFLNAKEILEKYHLLNKIPQEVKIILNRGIKNEISETPKKNERIFKNVTNHIIANNRLACISAEKKAKELEYKTMLLTTHLDGEAKEIGKFLINKVNNYNQKNEKILFIFGGETTVTIKGDGIGGRNQEMVLSSIKDISEKNIVFTSFATDGIDGIGDSAGAIADNYSYQRALQRNLNPIDFLEDNNSYNFFKELSDLLKTGSTGTNVMDIQLIVKFNKIY